MAKRSAKTTKAATRKTASGGGDRGGRKAATKGSISA